MEVKQSSDGESTLMLKALLEEFGRVYGLSRREQEIITLASTGHRTKEISDALGCATQTIGTYWERIYRKTKYTSREEVLALILRFVIETVLEPASQECSCPGTVLNCSRRRILTDMHELPRGRKTLA